MELVNKDAAPLLDPNYRSEKPVGSYDELVSIGADLSSYGCCAPRDPANHVMGCPFYATCIFKNRVNASGGKPPISVAVFQHLGGERDAFNVAETDCYGYYIAGFSARSKNQHITKDKIQIVSVEGDGRTYMTKTTVKVHPTREKDCPECDRGDCRRRRAVMMQKTLKPFPRPAETMAHVQAATLMIGDMTPTGLEGEALPVQESIPLAKSQDKKTRYG